jgi:hypothetical protein
MLGLAARQQDAPRLSDCPPKRFGGVSLAVSSDRTNKQSTMLHQLIMASNTCLGYELTP